MRAPLVLPTLAVLVGVLAGTRLVVSPLLGLAAGTASAAAALLWRRDRRRSLPALLVLWACFGALRMAVWSAHPDNRPAAFLPEEPRSVRLPAVVVTDPVGVFDPGEPGRAVCVLRLRHVRDQAGWRPVAGRLRARFHHSDVSLAYGDEVVTDGEWFRVPSPGNPGEYDWRAALARQRIHGMLRVRPFDGLVVLARGRGSPLLTAVFALRRRWERLIDATFSVRNAGLLRSLLLGERGPLDERLKHAFVETGTGHLLPTQMRRKPQGALTSHITL